MIGKTIKERKYVTEDAEGALQDSERRFQSLFHQAPVGISIEDYSDVKLELDKMHTSGVSDIPQYISDNPDIMRALSKKIRTTDANKMLADIFRAKTIKDFLEYESDQENRIQDVWVEYYIREISSFWNGEEKYSSIFNDIRMDGSRMELRCTSRLIEGHEGDWREIITSFEDITEQRHIEAEINKYQADLASLVREQSHEISEKNEQLEMALEIEKENNDLQRQFVTTLSHEFRTALAIVDGSARRLGKKWQSIKHDDAMTYIENIRASVSRMLNQIDNFLTSSRVQKGMMEVNFADCNLREIISEICHRQKIMTDDIHIEINLLDFPESIEAIPDAIDHIFSNLLSNAIKYSSGTGKLEVKGVSTATDVYISVRDFGVGIGQADMKDLFRLYFRAASAKGIQGTGVGLHLVRQLVELQNGSINVDSVEGRGSIFTVRLPKKQHFDGNLVRGEDG